MKELLIIRSVYVQSQALAVLDCFHIIRLAQAMLPELDVAIKPPKLPDVSIITPRKYIPSALTLAFPRPSYSRQLVRKSLRHRHQQYRLYLMNLSQQSANNQEILGQFGSLSKRADHPRYSE